MPVSLPSVSRLALLLGVLLPLSPPDAQAARLSARDQAAVNALHQRMAVAEQQYRSAMRDPEAESEELPTAEEEAQRQAGTEAALAEMEAVLDACAAQKGCEVAPLLATYKNALLWSPETGQVAGADPDLIDENEGDGFLEDEDPLDDGSDHARLPDVPESARLATLLNDQRHAFDRQVQFNLAVEAGIRRWLTDWRGTLIDSYENYRNMRSEMYPAWEREGLPEALLFGIMAKESNGRTHVTSRAGAAGLLQFMPATGQRFGLGPDGTGFDTRFDPRSASEASAAYVREQMARLGNSIEYTLAAYNGGEGRAARIYNQNPGRNFWDDAVYYQFPEETRDYVPMVIAAAWLYLHPRQYGLKFPRVSPRPTRLQLQHSTSIYELTICLGNGGTRDGFMRVLRNLNPRWQAETLLPGGTVLNSNTRINSLYNRYCARGTRAELARTLTNASVAAAINRTLPQGSAVVGDLSPVRSVAAPARAAKARTHKVVKGDTLGRIANRYSCSLKTLASANKLRAPAYAIRPGQSLRLEGCSK